MMRKISNMGKFILVQEIRINRVLAWLEGKPLFLWPPGGVPFLIDCPISSREIADEYEKRICPHTRVWEYVVSEKEWDGQECLVGHSFRDGTPKPACWVCPDCVSHVSYEDREVMKRRVKARRT